MSLSQALNQFAQNLGRYPLRPAAFRDSSQSLMSSAHDAGGGVRFMLMVHHHTTSTLRR